MNLFKFITKYRLLMAFIIAEGLLLRLYHWEERFNFHAELNVKAWTIKNLVVDHQIPLVGIEAVSYLHHLFYPPLFQFLGSIIFYLAHLNPAGMEIFLILLFIPSIILIFVITRKLAGNHAAAIASFIYSYSAYIAVSSRFIWVVGPMLLISLAVLFFLMRINHRPQSLKNYLWLGIVLGIGFNFHYQTFILFMATLIWLFLYRETRPRLKTIGLVIIPIIIAFFPLIIFDLRHDFFNLRGILLLVTGNKTNSLLQNITNAVFTFWKPIFSIYFFRIASSTNVKWYQLLLSAIADLTILAFSFFTYLKSSALHRPILLFIFLNLVLAFLALPFIQNRYYGSEYYLYFLLPYIVILISIGFGKLPRPGQYILAILLGILFIYENTRAINKSFIKPNYSQQILVLNQLIKPFSHQRNGTIRIYFVDTPSENYSYLIYYLTRQNKIDFKRVKIYEPWQPTKTWDIKIYRKLFY